MRMRPTHPELVTIPSMMTQRQITSLKDYSTLLYHIHSFCISLLLSVIVEWSRQLLIVVYYVFINNNNNNIIVYADKLFSSTGSRVAVE